MKLLPFRKRKFILYGKTEDGTWEEVEVFDEKKYWSDVRDLVEDGYVAARLEEVDGSGRRVKLHFFKKIKKDKKQTSLLDTLSSVATVLQAVNVFNQEVMKLVQSYSPQQKRDILERLGEIALYKMFNLPPQQQQQQQFTPPIDARRVERAIEILEREFEGECKGCEE